ncbi:MAG TPA: tetratricopeptide repeat protein, partial [Tepidisphaeraceae bacterium]
EQRLAGRHDAQLNQEAADLFRTADTTYLVGDLTRARELYERLITIAPNSPYAVRAHARLGDCDYETKKFTEAVQHYQRASAAAAGGAGGGTLAAEEQQAAVRSDYMIGQSYLAAKQYTQAFGQFRRFIDRHPGDGLINQAYQAIGDAHLALEQYEQALKAYRMVGTVMAQKSVANHRITPGTRLYLRVNDADVNISDTPRTVKAKLRTSGGDEETVELQPLGLRSAIFIATIPTALGAPRHSGDLTGAFSDEAARKIRSELAEAEKLSELSADKARELREVERNAAKSPDPAGVEKQRSELSKQVEQLNARVKALRVEACKVVDGSYAGIEKIVADWSPEMALEKVRAGASTQPATNPAPAADDAPAGEMKADGVNENESTKVDAAKGGGGVMAGGDDDDLAPLPEAGATEAQQQRRGMTQLEVDRLRLQTHDAPTTMQNVDRRLTGLSIWAHSLQRQFQRLEVMGNDKIEVEYVDEVGPAGPNDPAKAIRKDVIEVASDARIALLTRDGQESLAQAVLGGEILLRVDDADCDTSNGADKITVTLAATPKVDERISEVRGAGPAKEKPEQPATQRSTPGEIVEATTQPVKIAPLVPEGAASITVTLQETGPHTGIFERVVRLDANQLAVDGQTLPLDVKKQLRLAYADARAVRNPDGFVLAASVDCMEDRGGSIAAVQYRQTHLDLEAKLKRAVAGGEIGKIYLDLGLAERGKRYLSSAQADCAEIANAAADTELGEEALYHSWRIYFYAGLLDDAVAAAQVLMGKYPNSEYVPDAMLQIGQVSLERGEKEVEDTKAAGEKPGINQDLQRAIAQLDGLAKRYPRSGKAPEALFLVGRAKIAAGQTGLDT